MMLVIGVALAGAVGAPARYLLDGLVQRRTSLAFPLGTFVVNASGAFALGLLTGLALHHGLGTTAKVLLGAGFCGAFTTFSTFSYETMELAEAGAWRNAGLNVALSLGIGLGAAALGFALALL
jgi:CrcB protein